MRPSPAPWEYENVEVPREQTAYGLVRDANNQILFDTANADVACICGEDDHYWCEQAKANLTLAAAAPQLVSVLKKFVEACSTPEAMAEVGAELVDEGDAILRAVGEYSVVVGKAPDTLTLAVTKTAMRLREARVDFEQRVSDNDYTTLIGTRENATFIVTFIYLGSTLQRRVTILLPRINETYYPESEFEVGIKRVLELFGVLELGISREGP